MPPTKPHSLKTSSSEHVPRAGGLAFGSFESIEQSAFPDFAIRALPTSSIASFFAIEYADVGQDEEKLQEKIADLVGAGTKFLWVVRLIGPRRVDVHRPGERMVTLLPGDLLTAPGVLKNAVPVEALYDKSAADRATLNNLLQRQGFEDLETVLSQGALVQARRSLRRVLERRKLSISAEIEARIEQCQAIGQLEEWQDRALEARLASDVFTSP